MTHVLIVALGGAIGASLRHLTNMLTLRWFGSGFPWGTFAVNIIGSFLMGVFIELLVRKLEGSQEVRLFIATGIFGGFTTFSAFSLDTVVMWERGNAMDAVGYAVASVLLSVAALYSGLAAIRAVT